MVVPTTMTGVSAYSRHTVVPTPLPFVHPHQGELSMPRRAAAALVILSLAHAPTLADVRFVRASAPDNGDGLSWATAHRSLNAALDQARAQPAVDQIWVAAGTYSPGTNRNDTFQLVSAVAVLGGFAGTET